MHITAMVAAMRGKGLAGQFYIRAVPDMFFSKTNFLFNSNNSLRLGRDGKRCVDVWYVRKQTIDKEDKSKIKRAKERTCVKTRGIEVTTMNKPLTAVLV